MGPGCDNCAAIYGQSYQIDHDWLGISNHRSSCAYDKYILCACKL